MIPKIYQCTFFVDLFYLRIIQFSLSKKNGFIKNLTILNYNTSPQTKDF